MFRLRNAQIEIAVKLLLIRITVRMNHIRIRHIGDFIARLNGFRGKNHILVKERIINESAEFII